MMYEKLENCPSCKHTAFSNHLIVQDYLVTNESFALVKCQKCGLVFTNPKPGGDQLSKYYQSDQYISHTSKSNNLTNTLYKIVRKITLKSKIRLIRKRKNPSTILDYGCGTGHFLKSATFAGWHASGIEPDESARNLAQQTIKTQIFADLTRIKKGETFDVITAWHVLEHISELQKTFKTLIKHLNKNGLMFIALPNHESYDANYYKAEWAGYDVPRHLYHFSQSSFKAFYTHHGMKLVDTIPMYFDAIYVSMLSEYNQNKKNKYLKALTTGLKSNSQAKTTGNYSSLIYILKK